ncbi:MAG: SDR family oxidoreductase [Alphaproteobacteria bacterium]
MDLDLSGRRALVTGSTRGIGHAAALGLGQMGATVVVNGRGQAAVDEALERLRAAHPDGVFEGVPADLGTAAGCEAMIDGAGEIDVLVNNTGVYDIGQFADIPDSEWERLFTVNVMSGVRLTRHYLAKMIERNWGRIVFVSSESGIFVPAEMIHYGVTKAAQLALARGCAELTKGTAVTVNSVLPGPTWVEGLAGNFERRAKARGVPVEQLQKEMFEQRRATSLLQRFATAEEVANMICYACSPAASATNGAGLRVEGGIVRNPF